MTWGDTLRTATEAIRAHRLRSVLTMLGIVIGICSVTLTVGLGQGAQDEIRERIDALGSNLLIVSPGSSTDSDGVRGGFGSAVTLTLSDAEAIAEESAAPDVRRVAPVASASTTLTVDSTTWTSSLVGTTTTWPQVRSRDLSSGRFFTQAEIDSGADVVVLASETADELFERGSPVGQQVSVNGSTLTVVGVLASSGAGTSSESNEDDQALVPITTWQRSTGATSDAISQVYVEAAAPDRLSAAYQEVRALLLTRHGVTADEADFQVATQDSLLETANATSETMNVLLIGVSAISLLVGGIGVMNIMLVSVTERTKEIGLRKALGATPGAIRRQFLVEASVLGLAGGLLGVGLGIAGAVALPALLDQRVTVSPVAIGLALAVALGLGVGFGVHPAGRAAALTPIDALRND